MKEIWLKIAELFDHAIPDEQGDYHINVLNGNRTYTICSALCLLCETNGDYRIMCDKVRKHLPYGHVYLAPWTLEGAKKRADLCRQLAEEEIS